MEECTHTQPWESLLTGIFGNSPFLTHLALKHPDTLCTLHTKGPEVVFAEIMTCIQTHEAGEDMKTLMQRLRTGKAKIALISAIADLAGWWPLLDVTSALSRFADSAVMLAIDHLLRAANKRGDIALIHPDEPARDSGFIVLGMGKLGAHELNYSSDIDLIFFYEPGRLPYRGRQSEREFFHTLAQNVVHIMQQRTQDGYVFRTDLRLRPDPSSTPSAVSTEAALLYYENVGQNWERAAMIKARPIAGDLEAGAAFMKQLTPFLWRKNLDVATIDDILSIKRQMDTRVRREIGVLGHNVKLGAGGIREIELFTQVNQLIWGGRCPQLRNPQTCEVLRQLSSAEIVPEETVETLLAAYPFLRTVEHRLQMIADQQTHTLPTTENGVAHVAAFMGYATLADFERDLLLHSHAVHDIFVTAFPSSEPLGDQGNLVFTGVTHDPDTLQTLSQMGYQRPEQISEIVMGWHRGTRRCTRTKRARQLLTELMPAILKRFSETADPDAAFTHFDAFMTRLPSGVQLFSLFTANPRLLALIADIMGGTPSLAATLTRHPELIEWMLEPHFFSSLPTRDHMLAQLAAIEISPADSENYLEALRRFAQEKQFQVGIQCLKRMLDHTAIHRFLTTLAELILQATLTSTKAAFSAAHGIIPDGRFCVFGLGRIGSGEMAFGSDVDLVFIYDAPSSEILSTGEKPFTASVYYNRLAQRYLSALTTIGNEGRLYEVDTRLRPSGAQGLPATSFSAMQHYFQESAWTFERMALIRARFIAGDAELGAQMERFVYTVLTQPRDLETLRTDVASMRERVAGVFPSNNPWDLKHARGGFMDIDFICHYLLLAHAPTKPELLARDNIRIVQNLVDHGLISTDSAATLRSASHFLSPLLNALRLTRGTAPQEREISQALGNLLAQMTDMHHFDALKEELRTVETATHACYKRCISQGENL